MKPSGNPLHQLRELGQSPWCDQLNRQLLRSGELGELISEGKVVGLTSNPTIFQKALANGDCYDEQIRDAVSRGLNATAIYEELAVQDIQAVADLLRPVYDASDRLDGYANLEVSPVLAHDTKGSVSEARRLWQAVDRPNLMVKIPGTAAGLPALEILLGEGVNVNVTLLFGLRRYREVLEAHAAGLQRAIDNGLEIRRIASVASFFVSRVDTLVDRLLELKANCADDSLEQARFLELRGRAGLASARTARVVWEKWLMVEPMISLRSEGARPQRLLWASTSTKNPAYRDVLYLEELIGPGTVTTIPLETISAFADHGQVRGTTLVDDAAVVEGAATLQALALARIKMESVAEELEARGLEQFAESFAQLLEGVATKSRSLMVGGVV